MKKLLLKIADAIYKFCGIGQPKPPLVAAPIIHENPRANGIGASWKRINTYLMKDMPTLTEWPEMGAMREVIDKSKNILMRQGNNWPFANNSHWSGWWDYNPETEVQTKEYEPINLSYHKIVGKAEDIVAIPLTHAL